jgi:hypothetical protein
VNTLYCLEEWRGEQRISPPGDNFTPGDKIHPWGTTLPLGAKFSPRGEVKNGHTSAFQVHAIAAGRGLQLRRQAARYPDGGGPEGPDVTAEVQDQQEDPARTAFAASACHALAHKEDHRQRATGES